MLVELEVMHSCYLCVWSVYMCFLCLKSLIPHSTDRLKTHAAVVHTGQEPYHYPPKRLHCKIKQDNKLNQILKTIGLGLLLNSTGKQMWLVFQCIKAEINFEKWKGEIYGKNQTTTLWMCLSLKKATINSNRKFSFSCSPMKQFMISS